MISEIYLDHFEMTPPRIWYSFKQGKEICLSDLDLEQFCIELEFLIWWYRDDPVTTEWHNRRPPGEICECFYSNLEDFLATRKKKISAENKEK